MTLTEISKIQKFPFTVQRMMYGYYSDDERCFWYQKGFIQRKFVGQNKDSKQNMKYSKLVVLLIPLILSGCTQQLLYFSTDHCAPCRSMESITLKDANVQEYLQNNKITLEKYETDTGLYSKYGIRAFPTVIYLKNGNYKGRIVGYTEPYYFIEFLKRNK